MPGNFRAGPKIYVNPGTPELFSKARKFSKMSNFLFFMGILTNFDKYEGHSRISDNDQIKQNM